MLGTNVHRLKARLAAAHSDVQGKPSARELEIAAVEIEALWEELARHADQLAKERERNAALFERAPFACLITDAYGNVRDANLAAYALLEVPSAYLHGKPLAIFIAEAERESFRMELALAARSVEPRPAWMTRLQSPSGKDHDVKIDLRPLPPEARNVSLLWFIRETA